MLRPRASSGTKTHNQHGSSPALSLASHKQCNFEPQQWNQNAKWTGTRAQTAGLAVPTYVLPSLPDPPSTTTTQPQIKE